MIKVKLVYFNNEEKIHEPDQAEVTDGMLVMDWRNNIESKRVIINTLNLVWIEIIKKH